MIVTLRAVGMFLDQGEGVGLVGIDQPAADRIACFDNVVAQRISDLANTASMSQ